MSEPLISVCIITYNSSATVIETLDSIKNQTYPSIELVVSDDCSHDDTVHVVEKWLSDNKERFSGTQLITADENHGTARNLDAAIRNAHGEWIKILAGDDCLTPDCLSVFAKAASSGSSSFYVCDIKPFCTDGSNPTAANSFYAWVFHCASLPQKKKIANNLFKLQLAGPAYFFSRALYLSLYEEPPVYSMLDEWPLILKTLLSGNSIMPVEGKLVLYRVSSSSLSHQNKAIGSKRIFEENRQLFFDFIKPEMQKRHMYGSIINQKLYYRIRGKQFAYYERKGVVKTGIYRIYQLLPHSVMYKLKQLFWTFFNR